MAQRGRGLLVPEASQQLGEKGIDARGAALQPALKTGERDDARHCNGQAEDGGVQRGGNAHGYAILRSGAAENAENLHQPPRRTEYAEHGRYVGDHTDSGHTRALGVDIQAQARLHLRRQPRRPSVLQHIERLARERPSLAPLRQSAACRSQLLLRGSPLELSVVIGALHHLELLARTGEDEVVSDSCYEDDRAGQQRVAEGLAGIEKADDGICHGWDGVG